MRQLATGLAIAVAAAIGASGATALADRHDGDSQGRGNGRTLTVVEHPDSDTVIDTGAPGDSVGDLLPFANPIYDAADAKQIGTDQGSCVRTQVGVAWECSWTTFLPGGQIVVQGPFLDSGEPTTLAITGGTGRYARARGSMILRANAADPKKLDFVFRLQK